MGNNTELERQLAPFNLEFDAPSAAAMRLDLSGPRVFPSLILAGINALVRWMKRATAGSNAVASSKNVTSAGQQLAAAYAEGQYVEVYNNGANKVLVLPGALPAFTGGLQLVDYGIPLTQGQSWRSALPITQAVNAITATGQQSAVTVIVTRTP